MKRGLKVLFFYAVPDGRRMIDDGLRTVGGPNSSLELSLNSTFPISYLRVPVTGPTTTFFDTKSSKNNTGTKRQY